MTLPALEMRHRWRVVKVSLAGILLLIAVILKMLGYIVMVSVNYSLLANMNSKTLRLYFNVGIQLAYFK